jgi:hypothetical protein
VTSVELLALIKVLVYIAPLALLLRHLEWRWLTGAVIVLMMANISTFAGADRLTTQYIGLAFQALLIIHVIDLAKWRRARP